MQVGFPTTPTRDGSYWTGVAAKDDEAMATEKARLHAINEEWFKENCDDDDCKTPGVAGCIRAFKANDPKES